jgi:hypothetical protein
VPTPATGADGWGGWNLNNIEVLLNGTGSTFDYTTGAYSFGTDTDFSYIANVKDSTGIITGIALAKDWPVGEPPGIKVVNDDLQVKAPKPPNCIMATSYLADHFLDSADPQQVTCSGPFQSHKRYKLAMLPETVDGVGSESVDLVFNVENESGLPSRDYQIFQKINNWTDGRLEGFSVQVGFGIGMDFQTVAKAGVALADLNISVPSDIWSAEQLAVFSAGLFGPLDKHTGSVGYFDPEQRAGFLIDEYVVGAQPLTDILHATTTLGSDYAEVPAGAADSNQFGPWLPNNMLPTGIFWDDDGNPETDAQLMAWFGYNPAISNFSWMSGSQGTETNPTPFDAIPDADIIAMGENLAFTSDVIDDLVNVGLSYIVTVGDVNTFPASANNTFTIRVTPTKEDPETPAPGYVGVEPSPGLLFSNRDADVLLDPNPEFEVGSLLTARVGDADLNTDPLTAQEVDVLVESSTGLNETITLVEQGENRGVFALSLDEAFSNVPQGTKVTLTYVDANDGMGGTDVEKTSTTEAIAEPQPILSDVSITDFSVPDSLRDGQSRTLRLSIINDKKAEEAATGSVLVTGTDGSEFTGEFTDLRPGGKLKFSFNWTAELADPDIAETVEWTVTVTVNNQIVDDTSAITQVEVKKGSN